MPTYTIEAADRVKTVETQYGEMEVLRLMLSDPDGEKEVEMMQKPGRDLPSGEIEGTISSNQYGLRFKRARPQGSANGFKRDPAETSQIVRQHSQDMCLREAQIRAILDREGFARVFSREWIRKHTDWYVADAEGKAPPAYIEAERVES